MFKYEVKIEYNLNLCLYFIHILTHSTFTLLHIYLICFTSIFIVQVTEVKVRCPTILSSTFCKPTMENILIYTGIVKKWN